MKASVVSDGDYIFSFTYTNHGVLIGLNYAQFDTYIYKDGVNVISDHVSLE